MAEIKKVRLSTTWGEVQQDLNQNFENLNENKVEVEEGSRLITKEEIEKLEGLKNQEQSDLTQEDANAPSFVKGKEEFENTVAERAAKDTDAKLEQFDTQVLNPKLLDQHNEFITPTLQAIPNNGTLNYNISGKLYQFKVGQLARVLVSGEYVFYQLVNILNDRAQWKLMGSGGEGPGPSPVSDFAKGFVWQELINPADEVPLTGLALDSATLEINVMDGDIIGGDSNLYNHLVFTPANATDTECKWESSNPDIEIKDGIIVGLPVTYPFTSTITATSIYDPTLKAQFTLDINEIISLISVDITNEPAKMIMNKTDNPETFQLQYTIRPISGTVKSEIWTSSNPEVLTVSDTGLVTAKGIGEATVKLVLSDGYQTVENITNTILVGTVPKTITLTPESISWDKPTDSSTHDPISVLVEFTPADATWDKELILPSSLSVGSIVKTGDYSFNVVLNGTVGEVSLPVRLGSEGTGLTKNLPISVTYTAVPLQNITVEPTTIVTYRPLPNTIPEPIQLAITKIPANANEHIDFTFTSSNEQIATVDNLGLITFQEITTMADVSLQINIANDDMSVTKFVPISVKYGSPMIIEGLPTTPPVDQPDPEPLFVPILQGSQFTYNLTLVPSITPTNVAIIEGFVVKVTNPNGEIQEITPILLDHSGGSGRSAAPDGAGGSSGGSSGNSGGSSGSQPVVPDPVPDVDNVNDPQTYQWIWSIPESQAHKEGVRTAIIELNGVTYYKGKFINLKDRIPLTGFTMNPSTNIEVTKPSGGGGQ